MGLPEAIRAVILGTVASGVVGGALGAALGSFAPGFFRWIHHPEGELANPVELGLGLGAVCGLLLGAVGCVVLAAVIARRDAAAAAARGGGREPVEFLP